jgi:hypothetical protein
MVLKNGDIYMQMESFLLIMTAVVSLGAGGSLLATDKEQTPKEKKEAAEVVAIEGEQQEAADSKDTE